MGQTIQQQRAKFALDKINELSAQFDKDEKKEFVSYASGLPAMIHMNGLGQAMAFHKSKGIRKDPNVKSTDKHIEAHRALFEVVSKWLCEPSQPYHGQTDVLTGITQLDMAHYQLAQAESLVLMSWVKKFSKAFLAED